MTDNRLEDRAGVRGLPQAVVGPPPKDYTWPNHHQSCYDCGSTIPCRHTPSCAFSDPEDRCDLPEVEGTQWWTAAMCALHQEEDVEWIT